MNELSPYCRGFRFDEHIRLATDNVTASVQDGPYITTNPPAPNNFLLLDGTDFLLLDGTNFLLL